MNAVEHVGPSSSIGIRVYADALTDALERRGCAAMRVERPSGDRPVHYHLANATRRLWPSAIATRESRPVFTAHDILPRNRVLRPLLGSAQWRVLSRGIAIAHARHSAELLRSAGFRGRIEIIPMGTTVSHADAATRVEVRRSLGVADEPVCVLAGVLKPSKGLREAIEAARRHADVTFVMMGPAFNTATRQVLSDAPGNVMHVEGADDARFREIIAAADLYLSFRTDSVGEVSHTAVLAHGAGTPIAGYETGFLGEYSCEHDFLFPTHVHPSEALGIVLSEDLSRHRVPPDHPVVTSWDSVADHHIALYEELDWI